MLAAAAVLALSCSRPSLREEESAWFPIIIALNSSGLKKYSYRHVFATAMHYLVKQVGKNIIRTAVLMYRQSCILFFVLFKYPMDFGIFGYRDFYRARITRLFSKVSYWYSFESI